MVPVTAITMMNAVIASPVQRWSHKMLFRNMSCLSAMGVPFDVNETCGKVTGGLALDIKPHRINQCSAIQERMCLGKLFCGYLKFNPCGLQCRN
jgi:hypothetical protein